MSKPNPLKASDVIRFVEALNGDRGDLDAWLECHDESEVKAYIDAYVESRLRMTGSNEVRANRKYQRLRERIVAALDESADKTETDA